MLSLFKLRINPKVFLNVLYISCDTIFSFIIFTLADKCLALLILGILLVLIRLSQKIIILSFNYRKSTKSSSPQLPKKKIGIMITVLLVTTTLITAMTYFFNKHASLTSLADKIGNSTTLTLITYIISIWAVLSTLISLYPALWNLIAQVKAKESGAEYYPCIVDASLVDKVPKGKFTLMEPRKESCTKTIDVNNLGEQIKKDKVKLIYKIYDNNIEYFNAEIEDGKLKSIDPESKNDCTGIQWYFHSFFQCKSFKIPITIIDYIADMPFMFFAIYFSGLPTFLTTILTVCLPFGLIECILFNIHYFLREEYFYKVKGTDFAISGSQNKSSEKTNIKGARYIAYCTVMSFAFISASSKFFTRFFPVFHVSMAAGLNYHFAIVFAFIFSSVYMLRNIANMLNVKETIKAKMATIFTQQLQTSPNYGGGQRPAQETRPHGKPASGPRQRRQKQTNGQTKKAVPS